MTDAEARLELEKKCQWYAKTLENFCKNQHRDWIFEKLDDFLDTGNDVHYTFSGRGDLIDVFVILGLGGPGYWIDTSKLSVCGSWFGIQTSCPLTLECCDMILDHYDTEIWRMWYERSRN